MSTLIGAMGAWQFGYCVAIVNVPQVTIEHALGLKHNGLGWSLIVSATPFAAIFGAQFSAGPLDRFGRRLFLVMMSLFFIVGGVLSIVAGYLPDDKAAGIGLLGVARVLCEERSAVAALAAYMRALPS
jgi:MFS family permease